MARRYLTIAQYGEKYGIPKRTVNEWVRNGKLEARTDIYPKLIPDDQPVPVKDPEFHAWRWRFPSD